MSGAETIGDFQIVREIGRGGMGVVYEAEQISLRRRVALKVLPGIGRSSTQAVERFRREAASAAKLTHPNIIQVYAFGEAGGHHFIAMELVDGPSFERVLRDGKCPGLVDDEFDSAGATLRVFDGADGRTVPMEALRDGDDLPPCPEGLHRKDLQRHVRILIDAARALHAAHEVGVLHRDIKPANILIDPNGHVKLADFGLARRETAGDTVTASGEVLGTLAYMSPEQVAAKRTPITRRADVYALGVTLYEVLVGRRPFEHPTAHVVMHMIQTEEPPPPRRVDADVPKDLEVICLKAMDKDPERRYATALEFAEDLERYLKDEPILARPASTVTRIVRFVRRRKIRIVATTLLVAAAIVILALIQRDREKDRQARAEEAARNKIVARQKVEASVMRSLGGDAAQVLKMLDDAEKLDSDLVDVNLHRGLLYFNMDQPQRALDDLDRGLKRNPNDVALLFARGTVLRFLGREDEGTAVLEAANLGMVGDPIRLTAIGIFQTTRGLPREALSNFEMARKMRPEWPQSRFGLALANYKLRRFEPALEVLKSFLDLDPGHAAGHALLVTLNVGLAWCAEGERREEITAAAKDALAYLERMAPGEPLTLAVAASVAALDRDPGALERLVAAVDRVEPSLRSGAPERLRVSGGVVYEIIAGLMAPVDGVRARRYAMAALQIRLGTEVARNVLADLDAGEGKLEDAFHKYDDVYRDYPQFPTAPARLLGLRARKASLVPDEMASRLVARIALIRPDDPEILSVAAAEAAKLADRRAEAIDLYKDALRAYKRRDNETKAAEIAAKLASLR